MADGEAVVESGEEIYLRSFNSRITESVLTKTTNRVTIAE
jgi:hypothetical protein